MYSNECQNCQDLEWRSYQIQVQTDCNMDQGASGGTQVFSQSLIAHVNEQ